MRFENLRAQPNGNIEQSWSITPALGVGIDRKKNHYTHARGEFKKSAHLSRYTIIG